MSQDFEQLSMDAARFATELSRPALKVKPKGHVLAEESYILAPKEAEAMMHYLVTVNRVLHHLQLEADRHRKDAREVN